MAPQPATVHIRDGNSATLICPGCGLVRQIAAAKFRNDRHNRAIRCRCGTVFHVLLDFRRRCLDARLPFAQIAVDVDPLDLL